MKYHSSAYFSINWNGLRIVIITICTEKYSVLNIKGSKGYQNLQFWSPKVQRILCTIRYNQAKNRIFILNCMLLNYCPIISWINFLLRLNSILKNSTCESNEKLRINIGQIQRQIIRTIEGNTNFKYVRF